MAKYRISTSSRESIDRWKGALTPDMQWFLSELEAVLQGGAVYNCDVNKQMLARMMPHIENYDDSSCLPSPDCNTDNGTWGMDCYCARKRLERNEAARHIKQLGLVPSQNPCTIRISTGSRVTEWRNTLIQIVEDNGLVHFEGRKKGCQLRRHGYVQAGRIVYYGKDIS